MKKIINIIVNTIKTISIKLSVKFNTKNHKADIEDFLNVMNKYRNKNSIKSTLEMNRIYKASSKVNEKTNGKDNSLYWGRVYLIQYLNSANSLNIHVDAIGERIINNAFSNKSTNFEIKYTQKIIRNILRYSNNNQIINELTKSLNILKSVA